MLPFISTSSYRALLLCLSVYFVCYFKSLIHQVKALVIPKVTREDNYSELLTLILLGNLVKTVLLGEKVDIGFVFFKIPEI